MGQLMVFWAVFRFWGNFEPLIRKHSWPYFKMPVQIEGHKTTMKSAKSLIKSASLVLIALAKRVLAGHRFFDRLTCPRKKSLLLSRFFSFRI